MQQRYIITWQWLSWQQLSYKERRLLEAAKEAATGAYAPFSTFSVGAAALLKDGSIYKANNQENVAFPSGLCAERVLLFYLAAQKKVHLVQYLALYAESQYPLTPCGACRQVIAEYEKYPWTLLTQSGDQKPVLKIQGITKNLLPLHFVF